MVATSVINTDIALYNQAFYDKLVAMETFTYEQSQRPKYHPLDPEFTDPNETAGFDEYSPFWLGFSNAIISYLSGSISREEISDFLLGLFVHAHATIVRQRGSQQLIDNSNFNVVFNINGLVQTVLAENVNYYDDYIAPIWENSTETGLQQISSASAPRLQSDTSSILGGVDPLDPEVIIPSAYEIDKEQWIDLVPQFTRNTAANAVRDVYEGVDPSTFGPDLTPTVAYELVFDTLNWSAAFDVLNIDLNKPQRPSA